MIEVIEGAIIGGVVGHVSKYGAGSGILVGAGIGLGLWLIETAVVLIFLKPALDETVRQNSRPYGNVAATNFAPRTVTGAFQGIH